MSIHLITSNAAMLASWRSDLLQLGLQADLCQHRLPGQPLAPVLEGLEHMHPEDILLLEHPASSSSQDLIDLDNWLRIRPQLNVLLASEDNSNDLLLRAMRAGVREVLPLPLNPQDLALSLKRWTDRLSCHQESFVKAKDAASPSESAAKPEPGRLVAFMGCKGGNGTSFLAANMAHIMATEFQRKCAFVDLDLQCGDASFYLSSGANQHSLSDLTRQIDRLDAQLLASCLYAVTPQLNLLAAPHALESAMTINAQDIEKVIDLVRSLHDHVVVDLPRNLNALSLKVLDMADVVYIVMQSHTQDVRDAQRLVSTLHSLGINESKLRLLVNRYEPGGWVSLDDLQNTVGLKVHQTIPSNPQWVSESLHTGQPLSVVHDHNAVMAALRQTTALLLGTTPVKQRSWIQRWLGQATRTPQPAIAANQRSPV